MINFFTCWYAAGIVSYFIARASWQWSFGCEPIRVKTLVGALCAAIFGPVLLVVALTWAIQHITANRMGWLDKEIINPCKWFRK